MNGDIFIYLIVLSVILITVFVAVKFPSLWKGKIDYNIKWKIIIGYLGVLLFVTLIYFSFVQPNFAEEKKVTNVPSLHNYIYGADEQMKELPPEYIVDEWTVSLEDNEITMELEDGTYDIWIPIVVEKRKDSERRVEVKLYETPTTINGKDISEDVELASVQLDGNSIIISGGDDYTELYYHGIQNEMTLTQFSKQKNRSMLDIDFNLESGEQVISISIPKNVKVNVDENLFYVIYR